MVSIEHTIVYFLILKFTPEIYMIDTSLFTYFPPMSTPDYSFLGFSRYGKTDQITNEYWKNMAETVAEKVFNRIKKEFHMCDCCHRSILFAWDKTEVGIVLKKLQLTTETLGERAAREVKEKQWIEKLEEPVAKVVTKVLERSLDPQQIRQRKINEFAVKVLCEMFLEVNIDKKSILEQLQRVKEDGYLLAKSYYALESMLSSS